MKEYPSDEDERLNALYSYHILDTATEKEFDGLTALASLICDVPISYISFIDFDRQWFKSVLGVETKEMPREMSFCQYAVLEKEIIEIEDTLLDDRFREGVYVKADPFIRFYAGIPLIDQEGYALGTLCVLDNKPRKLNDFQRNALQLLCGQVMVLLQDKVTRRQLNVSDRIIRLSSDLICIAGKDGMFRSVNPAFEQMLGWSQKELLETSYFELVHPQDLAGTKAEMERVLGGGASRNFEQRFKSKYGGYLHLQWVSSIEPESGDLLAIGRNITEEKSREEKLTASEHIFRSFFENSQGLMCTHDTEGSFLSINSAGAELLGYSVSEVLGRNLYDLIPASRHKALNDYLHQIRDTGLSGGVVTTKNKDGSLKIWRYRNVLVQDNEGVDYVIGNSIDITESYTQAKSLERMQQMLFQINKMARIGSWEFDVVNQKLEWSEVTRQIHQVGPDFQPDMERGLEFYKEEHRRKISDAVHKALHEGVNYDLELQITTSAGEQLWIRTLGIAEFRSGKCRRLFGTIQDINQKKIIEQELISEKARLLSFVKHAPAAVAMFDTDMKYLAVSNRWLEEYRITGQEIVGLSHYTVFPNISRKWKDFHQRCLKGEVISTAEEKWRPLGWEEDQYLKSEIRPWYLFDDVVGGIMLFTQDITDLVRKREELKEAKRQSELASAAKSEFLTNMSHEIRTPLNGVIGYTDLVMKTNLTDTQQQYLRIATQSASALLNIINDILDFSKIEAGKFELNIEKCDVYKLISDAADIISFPIQNKGLEFLLNIPADLPQFMWIDEVRLKQVLINLLTNASKFTEHGEIQLKIAILRQHPASGEMTCRFTVTDTGIGIRKEKQTQIFEAFSQEDGSTTKKYGGTGLGLTISNKLLNLMGTHLQLSSTHGIGSTFFFDLTIGTEASEAVAWENTHRIRKVLVTDDNQNSRIILGQMLQSLGIRSGAAASGAEALEMLSADLSYDLVLMDHHMPVQDGLESIRILREKLPLAARRIPVVLMNGSADDLSAVKDYDQLMINCNLTKPVKTSSLSLCLSQLSQPEAIEQVPVAAQTGQAAQISDKTFVILIAEDNAVNMLFAKTIIAKVAPNAKIVEAVNGQRAVELCKLLLPDIIFMDLQMPEMNGYEATAAIRNLHAGRNLIIIALTAGNIKGQREKCYEAGMDDFITKPFVQHDIEQVFVRYMTEK
jgi:PAS domain S-box-containing protein